MQGVFTGEDIKAEIQRLQNELAEDTKDLARIRTEYHQAEQCLQNWQGRFALAEGFQSNSLAPEKDHRFFMAPIGSVVTDDENPSLIKVTLLDSFKGSCANLESWDKAWIIGLTKCGHSSTYSLAPNLLASSSDIISGPVGAITVSNAVFNYTEPYNNSVHISKYLIDNAKAAGYSATTKDQDPFTLGISPQLPCYLEAAGEQAIQYEFINILADIVAVDQETIRLLISEPLPSEFVLLDLKVYHPYIEGLTNLLEHEK
ncbi:Hypothetical protein GLP15_2251 [Giardia lamblia P15]|uniref:Uncharacterized protein n=1 Tax=Giardia intestinalis (strain P15) TaxID=658858 RepID=E1F737_GIAIA|nr:Hypothetical protein GLP15_2251 [Giardia lamblia P15]